MNNPFASLNQEQRDAVETLEGPLLVLAGAGSGKTRVVTNRIINLIQNGVSPDTILGLTFTNKAAAEMKERVKNQTNYHVLICTFHSLGVRILRESINALDYKKDFTIYDEDDIDKVLKLCIAEENGDQKADPKIFRNLISKAKNALLLPEQVSTKEHPLFPAVYASYQAKLKEYNALDFDDLLFLTVRLFREHPQILSLYQQRWKYLLIDEYQDTNPVQYEMVNKLVEATQNLCVVGDPDQSIYSWRGANIRNILDFEKDYPRAKVVRLEQNYRSRTNILNAANAVVERNYNRYEKKLWSALGPGERIKHFTGDNERAEAEFVTERIRYHHEHHNIPLNQIVVFYRTNAQSRVFEDAFLQRRIPYTIVGGLSFYQRREIKDILAFLRMVYSGNDFVSFQRTINVPRRGLGEAALEKIRTGASQANLSVLSFCEAIVDDRLEVPVKLTSKQKEGLKNYVTIIRELKRIQESCSLKQLVVSAIEHSGYLNYLQEDQESFGDRKENLDALIAKAMEWEMMTENPTLSQFLEELSLRSSLDESDAEKIHVSLMTIHNGKGLEFTLTFLVGLEEDLFPHVNSRDDLNGLEEERRLFYVGMTRAKEFLYLSDTRTRFIWGTTRSQRASRFLKEIPSEYLEKVRISSSTGQNYVRPSYPKKPAPEIDVRFSDEMEVFSRGDTVFHKEFGVGVIRDIYEGSVGMTYKIQFSKDALEKSLVAKYVHLVKL